MTTATILIPDISGFTEFLTQTEIKHSSHIINELLEGIIKSNKLEFHLSEVEGDAVLFYKKGEAVPKEEMVEQCVGMYRNFHCMLKAIERDSICRCGACTTASSLTLKFIVHFGAIQEIQISNFLKATGADMIVAHRLLKNDIEKHEYLLLSAPYLASHPPRPTGPSERVTSHSSPLTSLSWQSGSEEYSSIGKVEFEYAYLDVLKSSIPDPPPIAIDEPPLPAPDAREIFIDVDVPMLDAYQNLIDTDKRSIWVKGMTKLERRPVPERTGFTHYCLTEGLGLDHTIVSASFQEAEMTFIEEVIIRGWRMKVWDYYKVESIGENRSRLSLRFAFRKTNFITRIVERIVLNNVQKDFGTFKRMCEERK